jgi:hypothetical protein
MFDIELAADPEVDEEGWWHALGRIRLGRDEDAFEVSLEWWGPAAYERQWLAAARRLAAGATRVMFLASYNGPDAAFHFRWPAWRDGDRVCLQNHLILTAQLAAPFDPDEADRFVRERAEVDEDGHQVSEWEVCLSDVRAFVERRSASAFPA